LQNFAVVLAGANQVFEFLEREPCRPTMFVGSDVRRGDRPELTASGEKLRGVDDLGFALERISARRKLVFEGSQAQRGSLRVEQSLSRKSPAR
jgi:hypothetical protein